MSAPKITLDSLRESIEKQYVSYEIWLNDDEVVRLLNPLRLPKEQRKRMMTLGDELEKIGKDDIDTQLDLLAEIVTLAADPKATPGAKLIEAIGDDVPILMQVVSDYMKDQQAGEASTSES